VKTTFSEAQISGTEVAIPYFKTFLLYGFNGYIKKQVTLIKTEVSKLFFIIPKFILINCKMQGPFGEAKLF